MGRARSKTSIPVFCSRSGFADPGELIPHPQNPKRHSERKLKLYAKIIAKGWRRPIVVSNLSGFVISGHGARLAAIDLGLKQVPVDRQDFESVEAEKAAMLADNWLAESLAEYDQNLLAEIVSDLRSSGFDLELSGVLADLATSDLKVVSVPPVPRMSWVLIGLPTTKFGQINSLVEKVATIDGARVETCANNAEFEEEEK